MVYIIVSWEALRNANLRLKRLLKHLNIKIELFGSWILGSLCGFWNLESLKSGIYSTRYQSEREWKNLWTNLAGYDRWLTEAATWAGLFRQHSISTLWILLNEASKFEDSEAGFSLQTILPPKKKITLFLNRSLNKQFSGMNSAAWNWRRIYWDVRVVSWVSHLFTVGLNIFNIY